MPIQNVKYNNDPGSGNFQDTITFSEWLSFHHKEDDLREIFLNVDRALKYIHEHGYCIKSFHPDYIYVLNNQIDHIKFNDIMGLPQDYSEKKEWIKQDIFNSALIQIAIYSNCLSYLKPDFLKENFDSFAQFIPEGDVPYYRGVVQRGASVYFSEYAFEKSNRDLTNLESQLNDGGSDASKSMVLSNGHNVGLQPISNDKINNQIYKQINGINEAAFINYLIIPIVAVAMIVMIMTFLSILG